MKLPIRTSIRVKADGIGVHDEANAVAGSSGMSTSMEGVDGVKLFMVVAVKLLCALRFAIVTGDLFMELENGKSLLARIEIEVKNREASFAVQ